MIANKEEPLVVYEAAKILKIPVRNLYAQIRNGRLKCSEYGGRKFVTLADVQAAQNAPKAKTGPKPRLSEVAKLEALLEANPSVPSKAILEHWNKLKGKE